MTRLATLIFLIAANAAHCADKSYASHKGVEIFSVAPCHVVIEAIDATELAPPTQAQVFFHGTGDWFRYAGKAAATQAMAWGFILGFDTAKGGLNTEDQTTLDRLRAACEESPARTALEILTGLSY